MVHTNHDLVRHLATLGMVWMLVTHLRLGLSSFFWAPGGGLTRSSISSSLLGEHRSWPILSKSYPTESFHSIDEEVIFLVWGQAVTSVDE
mmetsp:Transcript_20369/g.34474  ORF Transcript_20369/g.34474 Transcript_20369/m.34474 type:complete len:90 (-) Transcript_20369:2762-3031(-)